MADKEHKYGVKELAKELGIQEASARVALRTKEVIKTGKSYGWNSLEEVKKVAQRLRESTRADARPATKVKKEQPKQKAPRNKQQKAAA